MCHIWRCRRSGFAIMTDHKYTVMLLLEGSFMFKKSINGALKCEWARFIEDDGTDGVPISGESL